MHRDGAAMVSRVQFLAADIMFMILVREWTLYG